MNLRSARMKLSVDKSSANSMCKPRRDKQVNIAPFHLATAWFAKVFLLTFPNSYPKQSLPVWTNGWYTTDNLLMNNCLIKVISVKFFGVCSNDNQARLFWSEI